jgi:hypothetical protein
LSVKQLSLFFVHKGPILFVIVHIAIVEYLVIFAIKINLVLGAVLLAKINEGILV